MRATGTGEFTTAKSWQRARSKLSVIFTLLTGYEIMFEESRRDIKPAIRMPKVDEHGDMI